MYVYTHVYIYNMYNTEHMYLLRFSINQFLDDVEILTEYLLLACLVFCLALWL